MPRLLFAAVIAAAVLAPSATASQLIDRNASGIRLKVSRDGKAMLSYPRGVYDRHPRAGTGTFSHGRRDLNARHPGKARKQVQIQARPAPRGCGHRSAESSASGTPAARMTAQDPQSTSSPPARRRTARTGLSRSGVGRSRTSASRPGGGNSAFGPSTSHIGPVRSPSSKGYTDWSWSGRFHHIFGRLTYLGRPVHGYRTTKRYGARLDKYGRAVYLDTFGSRYGPGWRRENSFVTHKPTGVF